MRVSLGTLAAACVVNPAIAVALEPGVNVDPGSPAAKEYALPLEQARRTDSTPKSSGQAPLFGNGIKPPRGPSPAISSSASSPAGGSTRSHGSSPAGGSSRGGVSRPAGSPSARARNAASAAAIRRREQDAAYAAPPFPATDLRPTSSGGGDGSTLALIGGGVAVLILGGFGGTVLRHSRRPSAS